MAGRRTFGFYLVTLFFILFSGICYSFCEKIDPNESTPDHPEVSVDTARRIPAYIGRNSRLGLRYGSQAVRDRRDRTAVMESNPIIPEKAMRPEIRKGRIRKKRLVFLVPLIPAMPGILATLGIGAGAAAAVGAGAATASAINDARSSRFSHVEIPVSHTEQLPVVQNYKPPPKTLPGFPDLVRDTPRTPVQGGGGLRKRWKDPNTKEVYEWDSQHGEVEGYTKQGKHKGSFNPDTGERVPGKRGEPNPNKTVDV